MSFLPQDADSKPCIHALRACVQKKTGAGLPAGAERGSGKPRREVGMHVVREVSTLQRLETSVLLVVRTTEITQISRYFAKFSCAPRKANVTKNVASFIFWPTLHPGSVYHGVVRYYSSSFCNGGSCFEQAFSDGRQGFQTSSTSAQETRKKAEARGQWGAIVRSRPRLRRCSDGELFWCV
jgi:hypothetical protein